MRHILCTHGQERQDSDYECAARDFQLSPNYVSNSYEIAEDFWEDGLGKGVAACLARSPHGGDAISKRFATEIHKGGPLSFGAGCAIRYMRYCYVLCGICCTASGVDAPPIRSQLKISENNCASRLSSLTRCPKQISH